MDEDMEALMPRTRAATEKTRVNVSSLKQYMAASKYDAASSIGPRSGVVVREDVRRDAQGFEDIDDFWADDDSADKDEDDDESFETEKDLTATDTSTVSSSSERQARLSAASSMSLSLGGDERRRSTRASSIGVRRRSARTSNVETGRKSFDAADAPDSPPSFDFGGVSPIDEPKDDLDAAAAHRRASSFAPHYDTRMSSPFAADEEPLSPFSDASDRDISVDLYKDRFGEQEDEGEDDGAGPKRKRGKTSKRKSSAGAKIKRESKKRDSKRDTKRARPTGKYAYKSPSTADTSGLSMQTDGDESFHLTSEDGDGASTADDDSFYEEKRTRVSRRVARSDLRLARDILKGVDMDLDDEPIALRRTKRRRYKPLAWYKGEHFVYERKHVGVGLVLPTVAGVERAGASSPERSAPTRKRSGRAAAGGGRRKALSALPTSELPPGVTFDAGEWADLFDAAADCVNAMNVICRASEVRLRKLPSVDGEPNAFAGQSFNLRNPAAFPRWISGRLVLPPGAAKEPESVGAAVQVFFVTAGQPAALEVAFSPDSEDFFSSPKTTRFLLAPGDEFYVPSGNAYYVKNHSKAADVDLRFTILKPEPAPAATPAPATAPATAPAE